jgi:hypothetical protein
MLGNLIGGFVVVLVGVTLIPVIANQVKYATTTGNVTGAAGTVLNLTTIFFALGIASAGIGLAVGGLRNAGLV